MHTYPRGGVPREQDMEEPAGQEETKCSPCVAQRESGISIKLGLKTTKVHSLSFGSQNQYEISCWFLQGP
jgi:hypothetical protein